MNGTIVGPQVVRFDRAKMACRSPCRLRYHRHRGRIRCRSEAAGGAVGKAGTPSSFLRGRRRSGARKTSRPSPNVLETGRTLRTGPIIGSGTGTGTVSRPRGAGAQPRRRENGRGFGREARKKAGRQGSKRARMLQYHRARSFGSDNGPEESRVYQV